MSTALVAGLIGLFGTALGTGLTTWTMRQTAARSDRRAWLETRRQEFRSAVTQFASALLAYRLAEADYWSAHHGGKADATTGRETYRLRKVALEGLFVLELSSDSDQLKKLARRALDMAYKIRESGTTAEMGNRTHEVRKALEDLIKAARIEQPGRSLTEEPEEPADLYAAET
jgi:hypothetical protein